MEGLDAHLHQSQVFKGTKTKVTSHHMSDWVCVWQSSVKQWERMMLVVIKALNCICICICYLIYSVSLQLCRYHQRDKYPNNKMLFMHAKMCIFFLQTWRPSSGIKSKHRITEKILDSKPVEKNVMDSRD
jgi:hypothetical protein